MKLPFIESDPNRLKIAVVIPFVLPYYLPYLLNDIDHNSVRPNSVSVIYNGKFPVEKMLSARLDILEAMQMYHGLVHFPMNPMSVNESWNYGMRSYIETGYDLISVLNDDIRLEKFFFEKIINLFAQDNLEGKRVGVISPQTVMRSQGAKNAFIPVVRPGSEKFDDLPFREGWAYTIRRECAMDVLPIPGELRTFCGDDWIWEKCKRTGWSWKCGLGVYVDHLVGGTCNNNPLRLTMKGEKHIFGKLLSNMD